MEQVTAAVDSFARATGRIDMLVISAGVSMWKDFLDMDEALWNTTFDVNVKPEKGHIQLLAQPAFFEEWK